MVTKKAVINNDTKNTAIDFYLDEINIVKIILTEDNANEIKKSFNAMILELKKGEYSFNLENPSEDLYSQIAKEYIFQLNKELQSVHKQLKDYGLCIDESSLS